MTAVLRLVAATHPLSSIMSLFFINPLPVSPPKLSSSPSKSPLSRTQTPSSRPRARPRATIAIPPPPSTPERESAPWMPLPGIVHKIETPEQFDVLLNTSKEKDALLVADFMASWCRKCLYLLPRLKKAAKQWENVYYCTVDVNKVRRLPKEYGIQKMPTFIFLKKGEKVESYIGAAAAPVVAEALSKKVEKYAS